MNADQLDRMNSTGSLDFVKFIVTCRQGMAADHLKVLTGDVEKDGWGFTERVDFKFSVLGYNDPLSPRNRYVFEAWGPTCSALYYYFYKNSTAVLKRLDFRYELAELTHDHVISLADKMMMSQRGKRNLTRIASKPRLKTNARDIGGSGLIIGSRKSGSHTVIYQRGVELPALEVRFQGQKAEELQESHVAIYHAEGYANVKRTLMYNSTPHISQELQRAFGTRTVDGVVNMANDAVVQRLAIQQAMEWLETAEESKFWGELSTEEQEAMQKETWLPERLITGKKPE